MSKITFIFLLSAIAYGVDPDAPQISTSFGGKASAHPRAALGSRPLTVFPGDDVLPQIANGDGWKTQIILANVSTVSLPFILDFWHADGSFWQLTIAGVGTGDELKGALPAGATVTFETTGTGTLDQGWAELTYDYKLGKIGGLAVFRQTVPGRPDFEAAVPLSSLFDKVIILPFDNANGFSTGVAAVNGNRAASATINVTFRDETGAKFASDTLQLAPSGQTTFAMPTRFPGTRGRRGTVLFESNTIFFSVLGLRFNPGGSFTSFSGLNTIDLNP